MVEIVPVSTKKQQREFLEYPLKMYKDNPYFVPPLWNDEAKIFDKDFAYNEVCEAVYYNAYRDGRMVGRISGIVQRNSNERRNQKRVRFTRFDCENDEEVARALFEAVEKWGREKGMDEICGPLGFSNLERQGLLVEGFEELATFEEQYNYPYYGELVEKCGYSKEVDWTERKVTLPEDGGAELHKLSSLLEKRYHYKRCPIKSTKDLISRYGNDFLDLFEEVYSPLYGTVSFTPKIRQNLINSFKLILNVKYGGVIVNEEDKVIGFGICFPSIAKALQKSGGHLTPAALVRVLHSLKHPEILELGLIGVAPEYRTKGAAVSLLVSLADLLAEDKNIKFAETNMCLEDNLNIQNIWENRFSSVMHKRRRAYLKKL